MTAQQPNDGPGLCQCGCGRRTEISAYTHRPRGWVKGQPRPYVKGHNGTGEHRGPDYEARDSGYESPCWRWLKSTNEKGYGFMIRDRRFRLAHVVYWEKAEGRPVPEGLELDHLCRNRDCVNPAHLEPVTHKENMVRSIVARHEPGGSALRDARVAARMSQADVGRLVGVGQPAVSRWEAGVSNPPTGLYSELVRRGE